MDDIQRRLKNFKENRNEMKQSKKVDIVESLEKQCEKNDTYIENKFFGIDKEDFVTAVDDDDAADGSAAAAPVVLQPLFEKRNPNKAINMGCSMDRQGRTHLTAFERGHRNCMIEVEGGIVLRDNQDPAKEAGKAVRTLKLLAMVCKICDEHYGRFQRLYFKVSLILRTLKPKELEDDDAESHSSIISSLAIKADGSTKTKKRKRPTDEEGKEGDE
jgi:hypothetical protein